MKKHVSAFIRRGSISCGFGPIMLAFLYWILLQWGVVETLTVREVCLGILSLSALAFIAGGMNFLYQIEQLPLMVAIAIHGGVLYLTYLGTYLLNGWLEWGTAPVMVFTGIFVVGYLTIWGVIYVIIRKNTAKINRILQLKQQAGEEDPAGGSNSGSLPQKK